MTSKQTYPNIDMKRTGKRIKQLIETAGYTPKLIQDYLHLSCVQPIYRWYKGLILPSVDHLLVLSELLGVHMEDLLVKKNTATVMQNMDKTHSQRLQKHLTAYYRKFQKLIA